MDRFTGKILIIEDDEGVQSVLARGLMKDGHTVQAVSRAEAALELLQRQAYDILLLDLQLPGMDGLSFLEEIRRQGHQEPVIIITGFANPPNVVKATKLRAWNCLEKPLELVTVRREIDRVLEYLHEDPVVRYLREHCREVNSRREVAGVFAIVPVTVSRRVLKSTDQSFNAFLHTCRVELAKPLLEQHDLTISQIADRVGFRTSQHFARIFHQVTVVARASTVRMPGQLGNSPYSLCRDPFPKVFPRTCNNQTHLIRIDPFFWLRTPLSCSI